MARNRDSFTEALKSDLAYYQKLKQQCLDDIAKAESRHDTDWSRARRNALEAIEKQITKTETTIANRQKMHSGYYATKDARPEKRFRRYADGKCE